MPKGRYWFHRHRKKTLLAVALLGVLFTIALAEIGARIFCPQWAPARAERAVFWVYDELLGWAHKPGQRGRLVHRDFVVDVQINSRGLRDTEYSLERTNKKRMLVLGDSYGWGFGVEHCERCTEILEQRHPDWEIINASVSGYGTDQAFLYLREKGIHYKPDVVLLAFYENDFRDNIRKIRYWHNKPFFDVADGTLRLRNVPVPEQSMKQKLDRLLLGRTYLLGRAYSRIERFFEDKSDAAKYGTTRDLHLVTSLLLRAIHDLCKANEAQFIVVSAPGKKEDRDFLRNVSDREGFPYLPLDEDFAAVKKRTYFRHDPHWNAAGHATAAEAMEKFLRRLEVFD